MTWWDEFAGMPAQPPEDHRDGGAVEVSCSSGTLPPEEGLWKMTECGSDVKDTDLNDDDDDDDTEDWHAFTEELDSLPTGTGTREEEHSQSGAHQTLQSCFQLKEKDYTDVKTTRCIFCQHRYR